MVGLVPESGQLIRIELEKGNAGAHFLISELVIDLCRRSVRDSDGVQMPATYTK